MAQYKTIAGPRNITIDHNSNEEAALKQFQTIIEREAGQGWDLVCINSMQITQNPPPAGCLAGLMGKQQAASTWTINMLVFKKG